MVYSQQEEQEQHFLYRKHVDWSLLHQGFALPIHLHKKITPVPGIGGKRKIIITLNGICYDATLYNLNISKEKHVDHCAILQIRYSPKSEIAKTFRKIFVASFTELTAFRASAEKKTQAKCIAEEYIELSLSEKENVFIIDCYPQNKTLPSYKTEFQDDLQLYVKAFQSLKRGGTPSGPAPHKLILLLSVIDCIENGSLAENKIKITEQLLNSYTTLWEYYIPANTALNCALELPYYHLKNDGFWFLKPMPGQTDKLSSQRQVSTIAKLQEFVEYAYITNDLYNLLKKNECRNILKQVLVKQLAEQFGKTFSIETTGKTIKDTPAYAAEKLCQPPLTSECRNALKINNKSQATPLPPEVQVIYNYLQQRGNKIFTIADLAENEDIKMYFSDFSSPIKKIRHVITEHADETYAHFGKRKVPICFTRLSAKEWCLRATFKNSFPLMEKQSMNYSEWAACLMRYFFPYGKKNENKHFFLCDGNVLCSIWIKNPLLAQDKDYDYIISDFVAAVIKKVGCDEFMSFFLNETDVKYRHLPFLCLQSLAWQYELPSLKRASNYYERFRGLIQWAAQQKHIPMPLIEGNLKSNHDKLWEKFNTLIQRNGNNSIVLPSGGHDKHIAYSNLHAVFKSEDSRRLYLYFAMQNISNVRTMRDAKEIFYALKRRNNEVSVFNEDYCSFIGHCIKDYFAFWCGRFYKKTFDPFSCTKIKYAFFNILGCAAYNEFTVITEEIGRELYAELQKKDRFLRKQEFRTGFLFYMNLARESWIENSCRFNWTTPTIYQKLTRYAQDNQLECFTEAQAYAAYQTLNLPYPWRSWMYADICEALQERETPRFQLDADCYWQVLCGQNRIYPVLSLENIDDTYSITQRGKHELRLQDNMRWITQETLYRAGFNLRESMSLVNNEHKWRKKIPSFVPKSYSPPHIYKLDYQEYADRVNLGEHLGVVENVLCIFPSTQEENVQKLNLPELQGATLEPIRKADPYGNYTSAILQVTDSKVTWDSEILFVSTPTPYIAFPLSRIRAQRGSIVLIEKGSSLPEIRNDTLINWQCDDQPVTEGKFRSLPCGFHTLRCTLQSGKKLKKDIFIFPQNLGMKSCLIADWQWQYALEDQESHLLEKQLLSASLMKDDQTIECFFEMPDDALFWWNYQIGENYTINTPVHYSTLAEFREMCGLLKIAPDTTHEFDVFRNGKLYSQHECSLEDMKDLMRSTLNDLLRFGDKISVTINDKEIFTIHVIPSEGEDYKYRSVYNSSIGDYEFSAVTNNQKYHWRIHQEQLLEALHHSDGCYIRGTWKNIEIFLRSNSETMWWFEKDGQLHEFLKKKKFKTLQELQTYTLIIPPTYKTMTICAQGKIIESGIFNVKMLYNAIQSHMDILQHQSVSVFLDQLQILEIKDVFADYSFVLGKEFLLQNVVEQDILICQLSLESIFFNRLRTKTTKRRRIRLDQAFTLDGTQYFLALDMSHDANTPKNCDELLDILVHTPDRVRAVFCYEQMTYLNCSLLDVLHETEISTGKICKRDLAEKRLQRFKHLEHFTNEFFTEELSFIDGLHEKDAQYSTMPLREHSLEYFLRNGFENWFTAQEFITEKLRTLDNAKIHLGNEKLTPEQIYRRCIYAGHGDLLFAVSKLKLIELNELISQLEPRAQELLRKLDTDRQLGYETKANIKALLIALTALKSPPADRESRCSLSFFYYDLLFDLPLSYEQQKYIHALYLTLLKYNLTVGN